MGDQVIALHRVPAGDPIDQQFLTRLLVLGVLCLVLLAVDVWLTRRGR